MRVSKWVVSSVAALGLGWGLFTGAPAYAVDVTGTKCADTGENSGGNPGGLDIFACTGLVEGDEITMKVDQTEPDGTVLKATAEITVLEINNGEVILGVNVINQSPDGRITSFGLGIEPNATGGSIADAGGDTDVDELTTFDTSNFPGFNLVEFCATSGNNCAGGGSGGVGAGENDAFTFTLTNGFLEGGTIDLSQFGFKFQGAGPNEDSFEKPGQPIAGSPVAGQPVAGQPVAGQVPQPGSLMLVGAALLSGLAATAGLRRFRRGGK